MNSADMRLCLCLHSIPSLSDALLARLFLHYGNPRAIWESPPDEWALFGAKRETIAAMKSALRSNNFAIDIEAQLETLDRLGAQIIPLTDATYPPLLRTIYDPPPLLYVRGAVNILQEAQLAVVGSRKASPAGLRTTRMLSTALVQAGLHICSGLALGVDGEAHRAALAVGGESIAVMATGIDQVYPRRHAGLAEELACSGALVTEYPIGSQPQRYHFPQRNRILSGLSLGVLVVEAALRSGSLITAGAALEQGREVFTCPWAIFHEGGRGCLRLIRDGAKMVECVEDILSELGPLYTLQENLCLDSATKTVEAAEMPLGQQQVLSMIGYESVAVDVLVEYSGMPVARVMAALSALELQGKISRSSAGYIHC